MATFTAVKNRGGGRGALGGVLRYTVARASALQREWAASDRSCLRLLFHPFSRPQSACAVSQMAAFSASSSTSVNAPSR